MLVTQQFYSLILTRGHDDDLCTRVALLYLTVWNCCFHFEPVYHIFNRMQELGLCSGKMNVYYLFRISTKQLKNVFLPGRPLFINFHRSGEMEVSHHLYQSMGLEVNLNIYLERITERAQFYKK